MCITTHHRADELFSCIEIRFYSIYPHLYTHIENFNTLATPVWCGSIEYIQYAITNRKDIIALYENNNTTSYNGNEIDIHLTIYFRMRKKKYYKNIKKQLTAVVLNTWTFMLKCSHRTQLT